ncbi:MAG: tRNA lysidine(34) synthetase TilS [Micrococcales bacterium]
MPLRPRLTPAIADVRRAVRESWDAHGVIEGDQILVACSGGPDSLALAAAAQFEGARAGILVGAVIVEHGLQAETKQVAEQTMRVLTELGLGPVVVRPVSVGSVGGPEAAARDARYEALDEAAAAFDAKFVMLGHTQNDQAETVLLGLTRGSGTRSLAGMAEVNGRYLRPLLSISRETVEAFCQDSELEPWHDPHNKEARFTRVRIRDQVLPMLEAELGAGIVDALTRTAAQAREDETALAELAEHYFNEFVKVRATELEINTDDFATMPLAIRHRVLTLALATLGAPEFSRTHILAVDALVDAWHGQKALTLPGVRVERIAKVISLKSTKTIRPGAC